MSIARPRRPATLYVILAVVFLLLVASIHQIDWKDSLSVFTDASSRAAAFERLGKFFGAFTAPELAPAYLERAGLLAVETLAVALIGVAFAAILGWLLALGASRAVMLDRQPRPTFAAIRAAGAQGQRALVGALLSAAGYYARMALTETFRLVLDVLRGVPDFLWVLLVVPLLVFGSPIAGVIAITLSVAGILGKVYSEMWDAVDPRRYEALHTTGAGRMATFLYGIQPLAARQMLSFTLMRSECAVRNASVIGIVGGGGLGSALMEEFSFGAYGRVVTLLAVMLIVTFGVDLLSNLLRRQLRVDPNHPRMRHGSSMRSAMFKRGSAVAVCVAVLVAGIAYLAIARDAFAGLAELTKDANWAHFARLWGDFLHPDFSWGVEIEPGKVVPGTLQKAIGGIADPLALAIIGTLIGVIAAAVLSYPASRAFQAEPHRFTGERAAPVIRAGRWGSLISSKLAFLVARGVPEVAWVMLLGAMFTYGPIVGILAIAVHSFGVLGRVFTESVDGIPYRRYEQAYRGSRAQTFLYAGVPSVKHDWATYSFFQFESNVRASVILAMIGTSGIGMMFRSNINWDNYGKACTYLIVIVLLTIVIDRTSRALKLSRG